ncbi:carboxylesterase family protein [Pedobacter panaciterrae]
MRILKNITLLIVVTVFTVFAGHAQLPVHLKVEGGRIQGAVENDLTVFRGIPFAAPPVGSLRWKAPQLG